MFPFVNVNVFEWRAIDLLSNYCDAHGSERLLKKVMNIYLSITYRWLLISIPWCVG